MAKVKGVVIFCEAANSVDDCSVGFPTPSPPSLAGSAISNLSVSLKGSLLVTAGSKVERMMSSRT